MIPSSPTSRYLNVSNILFAGAIGALCVTQNIASPEIATLGSMGLLFVQTRIRQLHVERQSNKLFKSVFANGNAWTDAEKIVLGTVCHELVHMMLKQGSIDQMIRSVDVISRFMHTQQPSPSSYEAVSKFVEFIKLFNISIDGTIVAGFGKKTISSDITLGM